MGNLLSLMAQLPMRMLLVPRMQEVMQQLSLAAPFAQASLAVPAARAWAALKAAPSARPPILVTLARHCQTTLQLEAPLQRLAIAPCAWQAAAGAAVCPAELSLAAAVLLAAVMTDASVLEVAVAIVVAVVQNSAVPGRHHDDRDLSPPQDPTVLPATSSWQETGLLLHSEVLGPAALQRPEPRFPLRQRRRSWEDFSRFPLTQHGATRLRPASMPQP